MEHNLADKAFVFHGVAVLTTNRLMSLNLTRDTMGILLLRDMKVTDMHLLLRTLAPTMVATLVPAMETTTSSLVATSRYLFEV